MFFLEEHPEVAGRSCQRCKEQVYDKRGRPIEREPGVPEPRVVPPDCATCPKNAPDAEELTPRNWHIYKKYVACRALGCLPRPGGLDSQNPEISRKFEALAMLDRQKELARATVRQE